MNTLYTKLKLLSPIYLYSSIHKIWYANVYEKDFIISLHMT